MSLSHRNLRVHRSARGITRVELSREGGGREVPRELIEYFAGTRKNFSLPLDVQGSPFDHKVWKALLTIPYGTTVTYAQLAERAGLPRTHARAVAQAVGRNPVAIIVPCHRVVSSSPGSVGGYAWGVSIKKQLLTLEKTTI